MQAGRQELNLGSTRLIGTGDWSNISRTFDALRLGLGRDGTRFSIFSAAVVHVDPTRFNTWQAGQKVSGVHGSLTKLVPRASVEPYVLWKTLPQARGESGKSGGADIYTIGARWAGLLPHGFDYAVEMARQAGHYSSDRVGAWAGYWIGGYTPPRMTLKPHFTIKYGYASGDSNPRDGRAGTFDQLYSTVRDLNGISDQVGWRNIRQIRGGVELKPQASLNLTFNYHFFRLASAFDGLYNSRGILVVRAPTSRARHSDVGQESDIFLTYALTRQVSLGAGYAHFFPGRFLKEYSPGHATSFPYASCTYRF